MTTLNESEIEINWLKSEMIPQLLKDGKLIANITNEDYSEFQINDISVEFIGTEEAFMLTKCYRAHLKYDYKGSTNDIRLFVKKTPVIPQEFYDAINFKALFTNELLAYKEVIPALEQFGNFSLKTAKFFYGDLKSNSALLITEDFTAYDWRLTKDKFNLSLDHTMLAIKYLANLHAAGFSLRAKDRQRFEELTGQLMESRYANDVVHPILLLKINCGKDRTLKACREYQKDIPEEFLQNFVELFKELNEYPRRLVRPHEPFVTLCHGDFLRNNVAYKYEEGEDGESHPLEIMMFDLQTLRVTSPMYDLTTFMGLSNFAEIRQNHFKEILKTYCDQLKDSYEKFAHEPAPEYLSYESLIKEYIRFLPNTIFTCSWFLPSLVEPLEVSMEVKLSQQQSEEEVIQDGMTRGGEVVDRELAQQMLELYQFVKEYNVDLSK
ncbi:uncharacterized protein LOC142240820 [Haematobia irritans]|uniref:uncharacterized protein LOC142240820 n=1 Tax=Haematobia irritans TaxID=7368 RepID=UPI003F4FFC32